VLFSERAGNGDQLVYCEAHAYWRRKTIGLPLVRRMSPDEQLAQAAAALDDDPTLAAATAT
jgi:hypothetical protein